jgi:hypothetical protein
MWGSLRRDSPRVDVVPDLTRMSAVRAVLSGLGPLQACSTAAPSRLASVPIQTINRTFLVPVVLNEGQTATFLARYGRQHYRDDPGSSAPDRHRHVRPLDAGAGWDRELAPSGLFWEVANKSLSFT